MRATHSGFLFQILLVFMQIAQSPKDANTGISSLLYTRRTGLQSMPPRPPHVHHSLMPFQYSSREKVPICPVTTCFPSLLPMARLWAS